MSRQNTSSTRVPDSWGEKLSKEDINTRPLARYHGPIVVVTDRETARKAEKNLAEEQLLGFDTETRPAFRRGETYPPSLLQLAGERAVYLFLLKHGGLSRGLMDILSDPDIVKAGVAIDRDLTELKEIQDFQPGGFVDLGHAAREAGLPHHGLRGLAARVLDRRISKSAQRTNWARHPLTDKQIAYAATDAWLGRELFLAFRSHSLV